MLLEGCSCSMVGLTSSSSASYGWVRSAFSGWGQGRRKLVVQLFIEIKCERRGKAVAWRRTSSRGTCVLPALGPSASSQSRC